MSSLERFEAAVDLRKPDRTPVAPLLDLFPAKCAGRSIDEIYSSPEAFREALNHTYDYLGGFDCLFALGTLESYTEVMPLELRRPGRELPPDLPYQVIEKEVMGVEDYDLVVREGYREFLYQHYSRIRPEIKGMSDLIAMFVKADRDIRNQCRYWEKRGVVPLSGAMALPPFDMFGTVRSAAPFSLDLHYRPEKVMRACEAAHEEFMEMTLLSLKFTGVPRVQLFPDRCSNAYISPKAFEKYALPHLRRIVEGFIEAGYRVCLHNDSNWLPNLPYLRSLPRGQCIIQLDGSTDIFRAKEILGKVMCILGDVPAALFKLGTPRQVEEYSRRLIMEVGREGGFILGSGCTVPADAKPENVKAMVDATKKYNLH